MKQILVICAVVALVGCGKKDDGNTGVVDPDLPSPKAVPEKLIADPIVEKEIRAYINKLKGELTEADLDKVKELNFFESKLTDVKGIAGKRHSEPSSNHVTFGSFLCVRLLMKPARCISREKRLRGRRQIKRVLPNIEAGTTIDRG